MSRKEVHPDGQVKKLPKQVRETISEAQYWEEFWPAMEKCLAGMKEAIEEVRKG